jgi:nuclear pore complex protein Nup188
LRQLLKLHQEKLRNCHDPYPRQSSKSRSAVQAGKVTLHDGELISLSDQRKENVLRISETFDIDEVDALVLWLQFLHAEPPASSDPSSTDHSNSKKVTDIGFQEEKFDDGMLAKFSSFYFEERRSALIVVASTLLIG